MVKKTYFFIIFCLFLSLSSYIQSLPPAVIDFAQEVQQVPQASIDDLFLAHIARPGIVVVKFGSQECSVCRVFAPIFTEVAQKNSIMHGLDVAYVHVDVDLFDALRSAWQVYYFPTTFFFKNGEQKTVVIGMQSSEKLTQNIAEIASN